MACRLEFAWIGQPQGIALTRCPILRFLALGFYRFALVGCFFFIIGCGGVFGQRNMEDALTQQGKQFIKAGQYQKALETFQSLLSHQKKQSPAQEYKLIQTYSLIGRIKLRQQAPRLALNHLKKALSIQDRLYKPHSPQNIFLYINLINTYQKLKQYKAALDYAKKALSCKPKGSYYLYSTLGSNYYQLQRYDSALYHYERALKFRRSSGVLQNIGNTHLKMGKIVKAIAYYELAKQGRLSFYTRVSVLYKLGKAWHIRAKQSIVDGAKIRLWRHRALDFATIADSLLRERQKGLKNEQDKLVLGQWVEAVSGLGLMVSAALVETTVEPTKKRRWLELVFYFLERQKANVLLDGVDKESKVLGLGDVQRHLDNSSAVLVYGFAQGLVYVMGITKDRVWLRHQDFLLVGKESKRYGFYLQALRVREYVKYSRLFYETLVAPVYGLVGGKRRWLVVGDQLNGLPFDSFVRGGLVDLDKVGLVNVNYQGFDYLIWHHVISYAPSVTLALLKKDSRGYRVGFCGVAPVYYQDSSYVELAHSGVEVGRIGAMVGNGKTLTGKTATVAGVEEVAGGARWLHLSTHGVVKNGLGVVGIQLYDGCWAMDRIGKLGLGCELVVLSSCQGNRGSYAKGEGLLDMGRSFIKAGVGCIVYSLWSVRDANTLRFMAGFYQYLMKGKGYAEALREAKLDYLRHREQVYGYPGLWAGFSLQGRF